jgi:hypothetical protein
MPETILGTVVFTLACIGAAWVAIFLFRLVNAAGDLFATQETELTNTRQLLLPKIKCSFGMENPGCVRPNTTLTLAVLNYVSGRPTGQMAAVTGTYYRLAIETSGIGLVSHCTGYLTSIKRNGKAWVDGENLLLTFAPGEDPDSTNKNLRTGIVNYLDFFFIGDDNRTLMVTTKGFQGAFFDQLERHVRDSS